MRIRRQKKALLMDTPIAYHFAPARRAELVKPRAHFRVCLHLGETLAPPFSQFTKMSFARSTFAVLVVLSVLVQISQAQWSDDEATYQREVRAPKPKFIRFGRAGAKFIRFGRSGANTWEDELTPADEIFNEAKRAAKFIRFG
ncbi:unnamed protein product [Caenorhabditis auriculariae]|uniref:Uncharacterized protein n=1 Tax=Caenorhabditis auriculariae TaxID=2777116 RepID=A0A8S1GUX7_9PELO|nr:unnamed protein product [Caenorhabditis auriculariae]